MQELEPTPENLRMVRLDAGLSQTDVAEMVYLSYHSRVSDWERGVYPIDPARWELLLIKLGRHSRLGPRDAPRTR